METLLLGASLGFAAGISPGPLLTLVVASTLERGLAAGVRVAVAPLVTDAAVIALALSLVRGLPQNFLRALTLAGAGFVVYLGLDTIRKALRGPVTEPAGGAPHDLGRGVVVNLLNPHPWLFWASVGGPVLLEAWRQRPALALGFLAGFYLMIVASKVAIAALTARGRTFLSGPWYRGVLAGSGVLLVVLGALLGFEAARPG